jgi:protein O-GlcNAc transferase
MKVMTIAQTMQLAMQNHQAGRLAEAEKFCRQALSRQPENADALHLLGVIATQVGQLDAGVELIRRAIAINPAMPHYHINLGNTLREKGLLDEAIAGYRQALRLKPDFAVAHNNLGNALSDKGLPDEAITACREALRLRPDYADAHNNLGVALRDNGQLDEAIAAYREALRLSPDYAEIHNNLGNALQDRGLLDEAIAAYRQTLRLKPDNAEAHSNLGSALAGKGLVDEAIAAYRQALRLKPGLSMAHNNLGNALCKQGLLDEAIAACREAIRLKPDYADAHTNLGGALFDGGLLDEAIAAYRQAVTLEPDSAAFHGNVVLTLHYHGRSEPRMLLDESLQWARQHADPLKRFISSHANDRSPDRRLKIGYVSPDFRNHPVGRFLLPLLGAHDPAQIEVFCYSDTIRPDAITQRIRGYAHQWRSVFGLTDTQVAEQIRRDQIDILVDLAGHTSKNRLLVFARKPAPVQVTWLGYPDTTGLGTMDYRLTDAFADPPGTSDTLCSERLIRLPHTAWCYQAPEENLPPDDKEVSDATPITFCSFNNFSKVTKAMLELWAEILRQVPGSRLLIKARVLGCQSVQQRVRQMMEAAGVTSDRLELQGWQKSFEEHLASYRQVHLALDTFPYHGTTTTCEALWMGIPVITLAGKTHVSRVGVSLLSNIALPELVADSPERYVRLASDLAKDAPRLNGLGSGLRERMRRSPLMDAPRFAADVESAYRDAWRRWCAKA